MSDRNFEDKNTSRNVSHLKTKRPRRPMNATAASAVVFCHLSPCKKKKEPTCSWDLELKSEHLVMKVPGLSELKGVFFFFFLKSLVGIHFGATGHQSLLGKGEGEVATVLDSWKLRPIRWFFFSHFN